MAHKILAVSYAAVTDFLNSVSEEDFDALLMLGVAPTRHRFEIEFFGRNMRGGAPDVEGVSLPGTIDSEAPAIFGSTLWTPVVVNRLGERVAVSRDAGDYLCNDLLFRTLSTFRSRAVGFLHVPPFMAMSKASQLEALKCICSELNLAYANGEYEPVQIAG